MSAWLNALRNTLVAVPVPLGKEMPANEVFRQVLAFALELRRVSSDDLRRVTPLGVPDLGRSEKILSFLTSQVDVHVNQKRHRTHGRLRLCRKRRLRLTEGLVVTVIVTAHDDVTHPRLCRGDVRLVSPTNELQVRRPCRYFRCGHSVHLRCGHCDSPCGDFLGQLCAKARENFSRPCSRPGFILQTIIEL